MKIHVRKRGIFTVSMLLVNQRIWVTSENNFKPGSLEIRSLVGS